MKLFLDFETRSVLDVNKVGAWAYAQHPSTEVVCMGVGATPESIQVLAGDWSRVRINHMDSGVIVAHNAHFEYAIYNYILHKRYGWPARWEPALWDCTMARAAACGLPLSLENLGRVLEIKTPKDLEGRSLMLQMCRPLGIDPLGDPIYDNDPSRLARLCAYNKTDVLAEMEVDALLPTLPPSERKVWEMDLVINHRGIQIDTEFAAKGAAMSAVIVDDLNAQLRGLTGGAVDKATQVTALKQWLLTQNVPCPTKFDAGEEKDTLGKAALVELLAGNLPPLAREVINIRAQVGKSTSTAKYAKALQMVCADGRVRGTLQYHGAHTGRFSGRLFQAHNLPTGFTQDLQTPVIDAILAGDTNMMTLLYGDGAMSALSDSLRGLIVPAPGHDIFCADYASIELCVEMWLADDRGVLAQLRRGEKPYVEMAQFIYNDPKIGKKTHPKQYDLGKRIILGGGYGMGWEKFKLTCKTQANLDISDELSKRAIKAYREKYQSVVQMWYAIEAAAINAVKNPSTNYPACGGKVVWGMSKDRRFLMCRLPSGRCLRYWKPSVRVVETPWGAEKEEVCYWGEHPKTHQWVMLKTYGGSLVENITQAIARDIMVFGMLNAEAHGFLMTLSVHDELLAEVLRAAGKTLGEFICIMCILPPWAAGCPVTAEGWVGQRYRK